MIFCGDVAICSGDLFRFTGFPEDLLHHPWCINLEGAVVSHGEKPSWGVCNSTSWMESFAEFRLSPVFIANNHILDVVDGVSITQLSLRQSGFSSFGAGVSPEESEKVAIQVNRDASYALLGFGWEVIGCKRATNGVQGVNRLEGKRVRFQVGQALLENPDSRLVVIIHGNYEFELYPQPAHRRLAKQLIDAGVYAVIFHHPHVVGPVELYRGRTIAYSLGNWAFSYGKFFGGKLRFPVSSFDQMALELGLDGDVVHHAKFTPPDTVSYVSTESVDSTSFSLRPEFEGFGDAEYHAWFRKNRKKRKLLPIYRDADDSITNMFRDHWVGIRQVLIDAAAKRGLKPMRSVEQ